MNILKDEYYYNPKFEALHLLALENTFGDLDPQDGDLAKDKNPERNSPIYQKFDRNVEKINALTGEISNNMAFLKERMERVHLGSMEKNENLQRLSQRTINNYREFRQQQNSLKEYLYQFREGRKILVDVILIFFIISMISTIASIANK
mmetsp:Transcript_8919/g.7912  ORF Transcript_8919/g.7912 Transcript_8919/m.7912 type:complete len:149 (+) Transcript_8919:436-882(+)